MGARILERLAPEWHGTHVEKDLEFTRAAGVIGPASLPEYAPEEYRGFVAALAAVCHDMEILAPEIVRSPEYEPSRLVWVRELLAMAYEDPRIGGKPTKLPDIPATPDGKVAVHVMAVVDVPNTSGCSVHLRVGSAIWFTYAEREAAKAGAALDSPLPRVQFENEPPAFRRNMNEAIEAALRQRDQFVPRHVGFLAPRT